MAGEVSTGSHEIKVSNGVNHNAGKELWPRQSMDSLKQMFPDISRTFSLITEAMRSFGSDYEADALTWAYSLCRFADNIADHKIDRVQKVDDQKKSGLSYLFMKSLKDKDPKLIGSMIPFMTKIPVDKPGYMTLIENAEDLVVAGELFTQKTRENVLGHLEVMVAGFSNPDVRNIRSVKDLKTAYYFDAQKPGRMINDIWEECGHLDHIHPTDIDQIRLWGDSFAIVLQGTNDYNDWIKDIRNKKPKLPLVDYVQKIGGLKKYEDMLAPQNKEKVLAILEAHRTFILTHYESSIRYCESLAMSSPGPRLYTGGALALASANLRELGNPEKAMSDKESKIDRPEVMDIAQKVIYHAREGLPMRGLFKHLLILPSTEYKG